MEYWRDLAARCDTKLPPGHPDALVVAAQLAAAYLAAGCAGEAVHWYQRVLADRGRELAPGHPAIIAALVCLAQALVMAGEPADAVTIMLRAVSECEQFRGPGHSDTLVRGTNSPPPIRPWAMSRQPAGCWPEANSSQYVEAGLNAHLYTLCGISNGLFLAI